MVLFAYIDASYGTHPDGKSHTGVCMLLGKGAFYVQSCKQKIVSKSSTEAEIVAVSDGISEVIWARNFLLGQGVQLGPDAIHSNRSLHYRSALCRSYPGLATIRRSIPHILLS